METASRRWEPWSALLLACRQEWREAPIAETAELGALAHVAERHRRDFRMIHPVVSVAS
jgi:hypothetical protein